MSSPPSPDLAAAPGGELLPCPFCGSGVKLDERMDESLHSPAVVPFYSITCPECDVMGQSWEDRDEVIAHWNTRWNTRASPAAETAPDAGLVDRARRVANRACDLACSAEMGVSEAEDMIASVLAKEFAAASAREAALINILKVAQESVCSLHCPSTWKTADGPPPHSPECQAISAALSRAGERT